MFCFFKSTTHFRLDSGCLICERCAEVRDLHGASGLWNLQLWSLLIYLFLQAWYFTLFELIRGHDAANSHYLQNAVSKAFFSKSFQMWDSIVFLLVCLFNIVTLVIYTSVTLSESCALHLKVFGLCDFHTCPGMPHLSAVAQRLEIQGRNFWSGSWSWFPAEVHHCRSQTNRAQNLLLRCELSWCCRSWSAPWKRHSRKSPRKKRRDTNCQLAMPQLWHSKMFSNVI